MKEFDPDEPVKFSDNHQYFYLSFVDVSTLSSKVIDERIGELQLKQVSYNVATGRSYTQVPL